MTREIQGFSLSPLGLKEERDQRLRWLGGYSYSNLNSETLPISTLSAMQCVWDLDRLIREVVISNPELGPVQILKVDVSDGFY